MTEIRKEKVTLSELVNMQGALRKLVVAELPAKLAYRLAKLLKILEPEFTSYEETRRKLVEKYGDKKEDGNIQVPPEKLNDFFGEINEVLKEEVEITFFPFTVDELAKVELTVQDIVAIERLLVETE